MKPLIIVDTDVLIEIFDRKSEKGKHALELLEQSGEDISHEVGGCDYIIS